jgi:hypothetical protein
MAGKAKRAAERQAEPAAVVDLNLWDVLLGLMEPADGPEVPGRDRGPGKAVPTHAGEVEGKEAGGTVKVTRRNAAPVPVARTSMTSAALSAVAKASRCADARARNSREVTALTRRRTTSPRL